jgi:hypothetical protein
VAGADRFRVTRRVWALVVATVLVGGLAPAGVRAADSESCTPPLPAVRPLAEGDYTGHMLATFQATGGKLQVTFSQSFDADLTLHVDGQGEISGSAAVTMSYSGSSAILPPEIAAELSGEATGTLTSEVGAFVPADATLSGRLAGQMSISAVGAGGLGGGFGGTGSAEDTVRLYAQEAYCGHAVGTFKSDVYEASKRAYASEGLAVTDTYAPSWSIAASGDRISKLIDELHAKVAALPDNDRKAALAQANSVAADINAIKAKGDSSCLRRYLLTFLGPRVLPWLTKDVLDITGLAAQAEHDDAAMSALQDKAHDLGLDLGLMLLCGCSLSSQKDALNGAMMAVATLIRHLFAAERSDQAARLWSSVQEPFSVAVTLLGEPDFALQLFRTMAAGLTDLADQWMAQLTAAYPPGTSLSASDRAALGNAADAADRVDALAAQMGQTDPPSPPRFRAWCTSTGNC